MRSAVSSDQLPLGSMRSGWSGKAFFSALMQATSCSGSSAPAFSLMLLKPWASIIRAAWATICSSLRASPQESGA
ncbi:hypothetical protein D3C77_586630 [compost metagenome]